MNPSIDRETIERRRRARLWLLFLLYDRTGGEAGRMIDAVQFDAATHEAGIDAGMLEAAAAYLVDAGWLEWDRSPGFCGIWLTQAGIDRIEEAVLAETESVGPLGSLAEAREAFG